MRNKNGFTLIELLAVIIILGILMIIAIPAVTSYINNSRKSSYITSAKQLVNGGRNLVNEGKLDMYSTDTTYYIPASYIKTENGLKTPYGDFTEAYIGVIFNGTNYKYYWISTDTSGTGIKNIVLEENLDEDDIESNITSTSIHETITTTGIGERLIIKVLKSDGDWDTPIELSNTDNNVSEEGGDSSSYYLYYTGDEGAARIGFTVENKNGHYQFIGQVGGYDRDFTSDYVYENYQDALNSRAYYNDSSITYPMFTRIKVSNGKVIGLDLAYYLDGSVHYLIGANPNAYIANRDLLYDTFGISNCENYEHTNEGAFEHYCTSNANNGNLGLKVYIDNKGIVEVFDVELSWSCMVGNWGNSWGVICDIPY